MSKVNEVKTEVDRVRLNFWLPRKLFDYVDYVASTEDRTWTDVIREAIKEKMKRDKTIQRNGEL